MLNAGGATCAASVATWARVHMCGDVLNIGSACGSRAARHFRTRSRLMESVGGVVGLLVGSRAVGLLVHALLMGTLGNGIVMFIECVILLVASVWGMGILAVVCTLGTY